MSIQDILNDSSNKYRGWRLPTFTELQYFIQSFFSNNLQERSSISPSGATSSAQYLSNYGFSSNELNSFMEFSGAGKYNSSAPGRRYAEGYFLREDGSVGLAGVILENGNNTLGRYKSAWHAPYTTLSQTSKSSLWGVYLVSDGGTTLSSINNPMLNVNNPNAPVNQVPSDVPVHAGFGLFGLLLMAFGLRRRKST